MLNYYQGFVKERGDDPTLQMELAKAYFRAGSITAELGSKSDALDAYRQAVTLLDARTRDYPDEPEALVRNGHYSKQYWQAPHGG